jgi:prevent-host-death family protein
MEPTSIPQRELRNDSSRILREVAGGREFVVTVRGKPVARLSPMDSRPGTPAQRFISREAAREIVRMCAPDPSLREELRASFDDTTRY